MQKEVQWMAAGWNAQVRRRVFFIVPVGSQIKGQTSHS